MEKKNVLNEIRELNELCAYVRAHVLEGSYEACFKQVCRAMEYYPHAPHPHNLMGILLEKTGDHGRAMKHFRAAWALDPTYLPADHNLTVYGTFRSRGGCAYDESDVRADNAPQLQLACDSWGISRVVEGEVLEYDDHGIGRFVRR